MKNSGKFAVALAALCWTSAISGSGCGGGTSEATTPPVQATTATLVVVAGNVSAPFSVSLDGQVLADNLTYLNSTNPLIVTSGKHQLVLQNVNGPQLNQAINLLQNSHDTFIFDGFGFSSGWDLLTYDTAPASGSNAKLRIVDGGLTMVAVDVYIVPFGNSPSGTPTLSGLTFNASGGGPAPSYQVVSPGSYDIYFTPSGSTAVLYHTGMTTLAANQNRTVVFLNLCTANSPGGPCNLSGPPYTSVTVSDLN